MLEIAGGYRPRNLCPNDNTEGGAYQLIDSRTGEVVYVGRTSSYDRRLGEHLRDPRFDGVPIQMDRTYPTPDYNTSRGLEQRLYDDTWGDVPIADARAQGSLNRQRPMAQSNPKLVPRAELVELYLALCL